MATECRSDQTAQRVRDHLLANDRASRQLGMQVMDVGAGRAVVRMTVREDMLNGHDICHGGLITALADTAFAFACNSYGELTVASGLSIDFISPAHLGDTLTATCKEVSRAGRTGVYDSDVVNQDGATVAALRGRSYTMKNKPVIRG